MKQSSDHEFGLQSELNPNPRDARSVRKEILMKNKNVRALVTGFAFASLGVVLSASVPNNFGNGEIISSGKVNANFAVLTTATTALEGKTAGISRTGTTTTIADETAFSLNANFNKAAIHNDYVTITTGNKPLALNYTGTAGLPHLQLNRRSSDGFSVVRFGESDTSFWDIGVNADEFRFYNRQSNKDIFVIKRNDQPYEYATFNADVYIDQTHNLLGNVIGNLSGVVTAPSDKNLKTNFSNINTRDVLKKVSSIPVTSWRYKTDPKDMKHMGVMAQDFYKQFGLGKTDTGIFAIDADGVMVASIQALNSLVLEKDAKIQTLEKRVSQLESLEARLAKLEAARR
jgi:hypothetical protein